MKKLYSRKLMMTNKKNKKVIRKRGRPRKERPLKIKWKLPEGVRLVALKTDHPNSKTHRWLAFKNGEVIGYFQTPEAAQKALEN